MKDIISKELKIAVWQKHNGNKDKVLCPCCNIYEIYSNNYDCGHMIAEANGGETSVKNLIPICHKCNCSMNTTSFFDFRNILNGKKEVEKIPEMLRTKVWHSYYKDGKIHECLCCMENNININTFECGLIVCKKNGGRIILNNLCPVCNNCYKKLRNKNIKELNNKFGKIDCCCCWFF
ncbi:hypothetical protein BMW23_0926 [Bodo saltans virus]|uniref:HNH endonuclease n=1 Tax=Bodo saltans virus TaxID=2024608 RepID=A0A2H4UVN0_9VIRU|nr:hypothetical protein QJ851_gp0908 [Bodo saltans virus]ATZ80971.1 hypothetical protein BMW23_0926 [Bodo saltans virus]